MSTEPTLAEILRVAAENRERDLFVAFVGVVEKFTPGPPGPPVVDVLPVIKRALSDTDGKIVHEDLPVVQNVPVVYPSATGVSMTWPITKGDHVLCVCTNWSHQQWRETGSPSEPGDLRTHEVGNALAIAGVLPKSGTLPMGTGIEVRAPDINVETTANVDVTTPANVNVDALLVSIGSASKEFVVLADKLVTAFDAHTHAAGTLLDSMSGAVTGTTGTPAVSITAAAIQADKLESE